MFSAAICAVVFGRWCGVLLRGESRLSRPAQPTEVAARLQQPTTGTIRAVGLGARSRCSRPPPRAPVQLGGGRNARCAAVPSPWTWPPAGLDQRHGRRLTRRSSCQAVRPASRVLAANHFTSSQASSGIKGEVDLEYDPCAPPARAAASGLRRGLGERYPRR